MFSFYYLQNHQIITNGLPVCGFGSQPENNQSRKRKVSQPSSPHKIRYVEFAASVTPENAANKAVTWSIVRGSDYATINATGPMTATGNGMVTIRATAQDGTMIYGEIISLPVVTIMRKP